MFECFEFDMLDEISLCVPKGGESNGLNLRQTTDCWYTSGDVKKTDAVMGANFAGFDDSQSFRSERVVKVVKLSSGSNG